MGNEKEVVMGNDRSRRKFLQAGLALPAAGLLSSPRLEAALGAVQGTPQVVYRTLGKTGLKVSGVGYGIGYVPVPEVLERAIDMGINYFDTSRGYQGGQNERMVGAALGAKQIGRAHV